MNKIQTKIKQVTVGPDVAQRYGRCEDVKRLFGLKKATVYRLLKAGKIKGCALAVTGKTSRTRLIDLTSVDAFIAARVEAQDAAPTLTKGKR
jgi:hypothetical protein